MANRRWAVAVGLIDDGVWVARLALTGVFALAAWGKLTDRTGFGEAVAEFGISTRHARLLARAVPLCELAVAVAVLPAVSAVWACAAALALLAVFSAAVVVQLGKGRHPSCSCFGASASAPVSWRTLARNALLGAVVALALAGSATYGRIPQDLGAGSATAIAVVVGLVTVQVHLMVTVRALRADLGELRGWQTRTEGLTVGSVAPDFELPGLDGASTSLKQLVQAGRPVALVFAHPGCGPCQSLASELPDWQQRTAGTLTVAPISTGAMEANNAWALERGMSFLLVQHDREVADRYRLKGTPTAVLIDARGRIAAPPAKGPREIRDLLADPYPVRTGPVRNSSFSPLPR